MALKEHLEEALKSAPMLVVQVWGTGANDPTCVSEEVRQEYLLQALAAVPPLFHILQPLAAVPLVFHLLQPVQLLQPRAVVPLIAASRSGFAQKTSFSSLLQLLPRCLCLRRWRVAHRVAASRRPRRLTAAPSACPVSRSVSTGAPCVCVCVGPRPFRDCFIVFQVRSDVKFLFPFLQEA